MLIKCPNCDAQYEVPNDIIPAAGRDVQCSSCSKTWFVTGESEKKIVKDKASNYRSQGKGEVPDFETTESFLLDKGTNDVDANVLEILRNEADREIRARAVDAGTIENTQNPSIKRAIKNNSKVNNKTLPDNIEIGSTLEENLASSYPAKKRIKYKNNSGKAGFLVGIVLISICWGAYSHADLIGQHVPETAIYVDIYKNYVESMLAARDDLLKNLIEKLAD
tara:strand:+ start:79 stop:744 length:666 start_codon:yes stop_codon:yes gene_type:complete